MNNAFRGGRINLWLCLSLAWMARASAATSADPPPHPVWTVDDALSEEWANSRDNWRISPDGRWAAWVKTVLDKDKNDWAGNIYLSSLVDKKEIQLTQHCEGAGLVRWSPDGQLIAFLSTRPAPDAKDDDKTKSRIWLIHPFGGEPWPLNTGDRGVASFDWAGSNNILYSAQEEPSFYERANQDKKDDSKVVEDEVHEPPVRLFKIDVKSQKTVRVTDNTDRIAWFSVSPDGAQVITAHSRSLRSTYDESLPPATFLTDLKTGGRKQIFTEPKFSVWRPCWQRDSKAIYAVCADAHSEKYDYPSIMGLYRYDLAASRATRVDLGWEKGLASDDLEATDQGFIAMLADGVRPKAARYSLVGGQWRREWITGVHAANIFGFTLGRDDQTLLYEYSTPSCPGQWYRATLDGPRIESPVQLTHFNPQLEEKPMAPCEIIHWKGALGKTVEGLLYYPLNYQPAKKYPLVVEIHGGPASLFEHQWAGNFLNNNLFNARGAFVFRPNYHGSSGYGLNWVESNIGRLAELEVEDINSGVDYLIGRRLVDPERLAVMGWSNGGTLTAAVTAATNRYKAAIAGDGPIEWIDYWGRSDIGGWFSGSYFGGNPFDKLPSLVKASSFYQMEKVTTPTLIFFGSDDQRVPVEQGWMHYRALQQTGKAGVRFVLFPGAGHGPSKPAHVRRAMEEELAWLDQYLFQNAREDDAGLKPESPLAIALKLKDAKADGVRYGRMKNGTLIPEIVKHGDFEIGRFEVTRAQFAEFDKSYAVAPGRENFPANGITFDQAKTYCAWLSQSTGAVYRLPNASEADLLYGESSGSENTLDYWAGEPINPDDAEKIQVKISELGGLAPLLNEVGGFQASGPGAPVFDLGGNVAEWAVGDDGSGKVCGGSADMPSDQRNRARHPAPAYIGFRVVKDLANASSPK